MERQDDNGSTRNDNVADDDVSIKIILYLRFSDRSIGDYSYIRESAIKKDRVVSSRQFFYFDFVLTYKTCQI